ncbi:protein phosphatase 2C domain-containing protein [Bradyrhizobium tunisiense]|uniref:protein phosphatase 2C domain-containing protein n=1 Tax=Bradyrhizobium tunisiense TaxID=3278709 RepID=UPI0035D97CAC
MQINWRSVQGTKTHDIRDCAGVGVRANAVLSVVLDGSTSGPTSGDLARQIVRYVTDWYVGTNEAVTAESLVARLRHAHLSLSRRFPRDSASYALVHIADASTALVLHAGDCLLGCHKENGPIRWFTRPHTLANPTGKMPIDQIARSHVRNRLTRSFRAREFMPPEISEIKAEPRSSFIAATDGFWAELNPEEQAMFMQGHNVAINDEGDDRSVLQIGRLSQLGTRIQIDGEAAANFYIKRV